MAINSLHFAFTNSTTVDSLGRSRSRTFAVYSSQVTVAKETMGEDTPRFTTVTYPLGSDQTSPYRRRTFAVLQTPSGSDIYRLPSPWDNFRQVMGNFWYDWFLPIRLSPCSFHGFSCRDPESTAGDARIMYPLKKSILEQMKQEAGLLDGTWREIKEDTKSENEKPSRRTSTAEDEAASSTSSEHEDDHQTSSGAEHEPRSSQSSQLEKADVQTPGTDDESQSSTNLPSEKSGGLASKEEHEVTSFEVEPRY